MKPPQKGQSIYIPSEYYLSHGRDDIAGGLAFISGVFISDTLPKEHPNYIFVSLEGIGENKKYNYKHLISEQDELSIKYAGQYAKPDPDLHPEANPPNYGW